MRKMTYTEKFVMGMGSAYILAHLIAYLITGYWGVPC